MQRDLPVFDILKFKQDLLNKQFNLNQEPNVILPDPTPTKKIKDKTVDPDKLARYNQIYQKIRTQEDKEDDTPKPWVSSVYSSVRDYEGNMENIIESLKSDDPKIEFESKKAKQNFRDLLRNIGDLYVNNLGKKKNDKINK